MGAQGVPWLCFILLRCIGVGVRLYAHTCVCLPAHVCERHIQLDDCKVQKQTSDPLELQVNMSLLVGAENLTQVLRKTTGYAVGVESLPSHQIFQLIW